MLKSQSVSIDFNMSPLVGILLSFEINNLQNLISEKFRHLHHVDHGLQCRTTNLLPNWSSKIRSCWSDRSKRWHRWWNRFRTASSTHENLPSWFCFEKCRGIFDFIRLRTTFVISGNQNKQINRFPAFIGALIRITSKIGLCVVLVRYHQSRRRSSSLVSAHK